MKVLIGGLLTRLVEKTSAQQCCVLWIVVMAESQEHTDDAVIINVGASTPTRAVRTGNLSSIAYQSESQQLRYNQVKIVNKRD